jgi:SRSO17 transposase
MNKEEFYDQTLLTGELADFDCPVALHKVDETKMEVIWDNLVREHHYLGYESMIGGRVKYLVTLGRRLVGAISFCSASYKLGPRDQFVGWDEKTRLEYLPHLLNNNRFLIFPWINVRNLASHILAVSLKRVREDWFKQYELEPFMVETFVDREKYRGSSYIAANWIYLGVTKGFGRVGTNFVFHGHEKDIYVYVMNRRFKKIFKPDIDRLPNERNELLKMITEIPINFTSILDKIGLTNLTFETFNQMLADHLLPYINFLGRSELPKHMVAYIKGLLSDLDRKSFEHITLAFEDVCEVRNMANFMKRSTFDDQGMLEEYQREIGSLLAHQGGMITGDGYDFPKKGNRSVGVARQYVGTHGKVEKCQASVIVGLASKEGWGLIDFELYMPEEWFDEKHRFFWAGCCVPQNLEFVTKSKLLSDMIHKAVHSGIFNGKYVGVDSSFGRDHEFLDSLPEELIYFADVPSNHYLFVGRPVVVYPEYNGKGRPPAPRLSFPAHKVKDIAEDPNFGWEDVVLGIGAEGPIIAKDKCIKVIEVRDGLPGKDIWLYVRKMEGGSIKYAITNNPMDVKLDTIRTLALMRWSIEQCFIECKEYLGMDHYETRAWTAWRRHILFTLIAHLFIIKLQRRFSIR